MEVPAEHVVAFAVKVATTYESDEYSKDIIRCFVEMPRAELILIAVKLANMMNTVLATMFPDRPLDELWAALLDEISSARE